MLMAAIRGHQRSSEVIGGRALLMAAIRGHQRSSVIIRGRTLLMAAIRGHQRSSVIIRGRTLLMAAECTGACLARWALHRASYLWGRARRRGEHLHAWPGGHGTVPRTDESRQRAVRRWNVLGPSPPWPRAPTSGRRTSRGAPPRRPAAMRRRIERRRRPSRPRWPKRASARAGASGYPRVCPPP